ncbi:hypothetical protein IWQ55_000790 [Labrenzia sp. EL_208]|nr:hypothetical protein [Labrenzia sp. EL_132]MBG6227592.1 hypothetical protein [Labrenzia sp. EL_208]
MCRLGFGVPCTRTFYLALHRSYPILPLLAVAVLEIFSFQSREKEADPRCSTEDLRFLDRTKIPAVEGIRVFLKQEDLMVLQLPAPLPARQLPTVTIR